MVEDLLGEDGPCVQRQHEGKQECSRHGVIFPKGRLYHLFQPRRLGMEVVSGLVSNAACMTRVSLELLQAGPEVTNSPGDPTSSLCDCGGARSSRRLHKLTGVADL